MGTTNRRALLAVALLACGSFVFAKDPGRTSDEQARLQNSGQVMHEILNVPDDIPQDLLDKARCVVVMPSALKAAFVVGGSYRRGTMVCRTGTDFTGPWGAPARGTVCPRGNPGPCRLSENYGETCADFVEHTKRLSWWFQIKIGVFNG